MVLVFITLENYRIAYAPFTFSILQNSFHIKHVRQAHILHMYEYAQHPLIEIPNFMAPKSVSSGSWHTLKDETQEVAPCDATRK